MKQPAPKLRVVTPSPVAQPELSYQIEPFYVVARELHPLLRKHWREVGTHKDLVPFDPNWDAWMQQSIARILHVLTVRYTDEIVGYAFALVSTHVLYKTTLHASIDMLWLDPRFRHGLVGLRMLRLLDDHLRKLGVVRVAISEKLTWANARGRRLRVLFKRLGYKAAEVSYVKVFDG